MTVIQSLPSHPEISLSDLISGEPEDRAQVSSDEIFDFSQKNIESILSHIEFEIHAITLDAQKLADFFWSEKRKVKDTPGMKYGYFGVRVRLRPNDYFTATWYKAKPLLKGETIILDELKKGSGVDKYPERTFKHAEPYEKQAIEFVEEGLSKLRKRYALLSKIRRQMNTYMKLVDTEGAD